MGWLPPINWCRISSIHRMIQQWIWQKMKKWILMILEPPRTTWRLLVLCVFGVTQPPWWSNICCRTTWWQPMDHQNALDSRRWSYLPWQHEWLHDLQGFKRFHQEKLVVFIVRKPPWLDGLWKKPSKLSWKLGVALFLRNLQLEGDGMKTWQEWHHFPFAERWFSPYS